jgi:1-aminocyclopropane-1-carboxylate deaminase/D-cysteine desulfhydrase-like pyridoxal-dependent ACC family enzyme
MTEPDNRRPLFEYYRGLEVKLPLVRLAELPTPVRRLSKLESRTAAQNFWMKDDGVSSPFYGGNKVRKLELLLAAAKAANAKTVLTFGYAGSNHATATAVHASRLGIRSISCLLPQQNAAYLRKNLLVSLAVGAELHEFSSRSVLIAGALWTLLRTRSREGKSPSVIAAGGSSPLGTIGFVNAAFELHEQIEDGVVPAPERIYVAAGSLGSAIGLAIGLAALERKIPIHAVRVVDERFVNASRAKALWKKTAALLRASDRSFPDEGEMGDRVVLRGEFFGGKYACKTPEASDAIRLASRNESVSLDRTYTAKAVACALADAREGRFPKGPVLFWNTCNAADLDDLAADAEPAGLPKRLKRYFELDDTFTDD